MTVRWEFRMMHHVSKTDGDWYDIFYVCIDEQSDKPVTRSIHPVYPSGIGKAELRIDLEQMMRALDKPVLHDSDFPEEEVYVKAEDGCEKEYCGCGCEDSETSD